MNCIRILYAGSTYPTPDYNLQFNNYNVNSNFESYTQYQSNDLYRAFYDFLTNSDGLRDRSGTLHNFETWQLAPIFIWKTHQAPNNDDNSCLVSTFFSNTNSTGGVTGASNAHLLIMGFYDDVLKIKYNEYGKYDGLTIE